MPPSKARSGVLLEQMWQRFLGSYTVRFPDVKAPSKRVVSGWLSCDTHALARWTNDAAHQSKHPQWRVPLRRTLEVCHVLEADTAERDALMMARIGEVQETDESPEVMVVLQWLTPTVTELVGRPVLDGQEEQVLVAFRAARAGISGAENVGATMPLEDELQRGLKDWLGRALGAHADELHAEDLAGGPVDVALLKQRAQRVVAGLAKQRAATKKVAPSAAEMGRVVNAFRAAMRKAARASEG